MFKYNFMLFHRNFTYWIDKRKWKYVFLLLTLELSSAGQSCSALWQDNAIVPFPARIAELTGPSFHF